MPLLQILIVYHPAVVDTDDYYPTLVLFHLEVYLLFLDYIQYKLIATDKAIRNRLSRKSLRRTGSLWKKLK